MSRYLRLAGWYNLILVVVINVIIVGFTRGNLAVLPWVPIISIAILAFDAITRRKRVGSEDVRTRLFHSQSSLLSHGGKVVLSPLGMVS
jgi:hypothetical protein